MYIGTAIKEHANTNTLMDITIHYQNSIVRFIECTQFQASTPAPMTPPTRAKIGPPRQKPATIPVTAPITILECLIRSPGGEGGGVCK